MSMVILKKIKNISVFASIWVVNRGATRILFGGFRHGNTLETPVFGAETTENKIA
jgi:hypothetical protein